MTSSSLQQNIPESTSSMQQQNAPESSSQEAPAYEIVGRTMKLEEWELTIQTENPVDFISLAHHGCGIRSYYEAHGLMDYFTGLEPQSTTKLLQKLKRGRKF
jgi:hypothetical protein